MTREETKGILPFVQAFAEGKRVQARGKCTGVWCDIHEGHQFSTALYDYRIMQEPKYRPFNSVEECWQEMQKHRPFGWLKDAKTGEYTNMGYVWKNPETSDGVMFNVISYGWSSPTALFGRVTFADGTPFGVKDSYYNH